MFTLRSLIVLTLAVAASGGSRAPLAAQTPVGTAFSFQGRLTEAGSAANGLYDLQFTLYDASSAGSPIGAPVGQDDVTVSGGVFNVLIDFGASAFNGDARWLEVAVRPGASTGAYTTIAPRQRLSPTPYALEALRFGGKPASDYALQTSVDSLESDVATLQTALASAPTLSGTQTFTGANTFSGVTTMTNPANALTGVLRFAESAAACSAENAGVARWVGLEKTLELCSGTEWIRMAPPPSHARQSASNITVSCWGGAPTTFVNTGVTGGYTGTGRPATVLVSISNATTTGAAGASFRIFVVDNSSELGRVRKLLRSDGAELVQFELWFGGFGAGSMPTLRLECAADAAGPQIVNATVELLIREM